MFSHISYAGTDDSTTEFYNAQMYAFLLCAMLKNIIHHTIFALMKIYFHNMQM